MATTSSRMLGYHLLRLSTVVLLLKVPLVHASVADDESFAALWASSPALTCDAALVSSCSDSAQIKCLFRASHRVSDLIKTSLPAGAGSTDAARVHSPVALVRTNPK